MLTLHKFGPAWGIPDISPFVIKLETYLRMSGIPYEAKTGDPRKAPKRKLPYIDDDGVVLGDTRFIIEHLETKRGVSLDALLTPKERAIAMAFSSMLEEHLYFVLVYERWQVDANWERLSPTLRSVLTAIGMPAAISGLGATMARNQMLRSLQAQGTGRHTHAEVGRIGERIVGALAERLGAGPFFFGDEPSTLDATVYGFMVGLLDAPFEGPVVEATRRRENLRAYVDRIKKRYWAA
jgi:glutathione S-transferase